MRFSPNAPILIRHARREDALELARLAVIDSAQAPQGDVLLAEVDGALVAAIGLDDGRRVADPFRPTAAVLALLEAHAGRSRRSGRGRPGIRARRPALRAA